MATIRDVARESNVSIATVSRVFNNSPLVSDTTRQRVAAVAARMGYWPNGIARSLITSRTHTVGVLLPDLHGEFFSEVIRGIDLAARERGFHILVSRSSSSADELAEGLRSMRGRVEGLIVMAPDLEDAPATLRQCAGNIAVVLLDPDGAVPGYDSISIANFEGASIVVRHLLGLGHRHIATITGPVHNIDARQRLDGYHAALREGGVEPCSDLELPGNFTEPSGYEAARELLRRVPPPTAIFVANDHMAVGVMGALQDAEVRVPEDIAVVGFDDIPTARFLTPPLTTVRVDRLMLGQRALQMLVDTDRTVGPAAGRHEVVPITLVVRGSCGAGKANGSHARVHWEQAVPVPPAKQGA
jgi:LacI family transcriptional regulator